MTSITISLTIAPVQTQRRAWLGEELGKDPLTESRKLLRGVETTKDTRRMQLCKDDSGCCHHLPTYPFQLIPSTFILHVPTIIYIFTFLFIIFIKFIPEVYICPCIYVPVRLSIHDNLCILYPAFSPFYLYRHAYLRVLWSALNVTSELSVHVDGQLPLLYLDTGKAQCQ